MGNWRAGIGCLMIVAVILYLAVLGPILANRDDGADAGGEAIPTASPTAARSVTLRYFVVSSPPESHARITYRNEQGATEEVPDYQGPWDKVLPFTTGVTASLTAQSAPGAGAADTITCEIQIDGQGWRKETATGPSATVMCGGVVGQ